MRTVHETHDSPEQSDHGSDDDTEPEPYPFYKRFWKTPGPGASIGLLCNKEVYATIGCYVHVDRRLYMLTVEHFITKSCGRLLTGESAEKTVVSPALSDVDDLKERFTQMIRDFDVELTEAWREHLGDQWAEHAPLNSIEPFPDNLKDVLDKLEIVKEDLSHLLGGDESLKLGSVAYQSTTPSSPDCSLQLLPEQNHGHHMDWALISVSGERAGTNRHRYRYERDVGKVDFYTGETSTVGAGQPFMDTCDVQGNTKVHFVGQATGHRSGEINPARVLISHNGTLSIEWSMVVSTNRKGDNDITHRGDSGASIIRDDDNKIVALLWACTKDGQLVITPIKAIFEDIKLKLPADEVCLPQVDRPPPSAAPLRTTAVEVETICGDKKTERPKLRRTFRSTDMPSPRHKQALESSMPKKDSVRIIPPPARKAISLPTPLESALGCPSFKPSDGTFRPVLLPFHRLIQQMPKGWDDRGNKHAIAFVLSGLRANKLAKRSTFPQTQDKLLPGKSVRQDLCFDSHNVELIHAY